MFKNLQIGQTTIVNKILNVFLRPEVYLLAFFISLSIHASTQVRIGVVDTGFCPNLLKKINKNVTIHPVFDATYSVRMNCKKIDQKHRRFHGQWVLQTFLENLPNDVQIDLWPVIIFDFEANQKSQYWVNALAYLEKKRPDVILSAAGLPIQKTVPDQLKLINSNFFIASGRSGGPIKDTTKLFPHELAPHEQIFMIGSYYPPLNKDDFVFDDKLLYQEKIDYYFSQGPMGDQFVGTSRSVAEALGRSITICGEFFHQKSELLRKCLEQKQRLIKTAYTNKILKTF